MSAKFPQVFIESGPVGAGIQIGDAIVIEFLPLLHIGVMQWPRMARFGMGRGRQGIVVVGTMVTHEHRVLRFNPHTKHFEGTFNYSHEGSCTWWKAEERFHTHDFSVRLREDGSSVGVVREIHGRLLCQPRRLAPTTDDYRSLWTGRDHDGRLVDVTVIEDDNGALRFEERERCPGVALEVLLKTCAGTLDRDRALNIAMQCVSDAKWVIGFDGVARRASGDGASNQAFRFYTYSTLTATGTVDPAEIEAQMRTGAVPPDGAVGEFVRAMFPDEWAREQQFLEEVAVLG
jgi:hypothetical protein